MADKVMMDFYERVARIERAHASGMGFEAPGTLGRSHYPRPRRLRTPVMGPVITLACGILALKAVLHASLGAQDYEARAAALWQAGPVEQVGAVVMQPDPVSSWLAAQIKALTP